MKHAVCPYCHTVIPAERYRGGKDIIPEFLICDVCGKKMELVEHDGYLSESILHRVIEKMNQYADAEVE